MTTHDAHLLGAKHRVARLSARRARRDRAAAAAAVRRAEEAAVEHDELHGAWRAPKPARLAPTRGEGGRGGFRAPPAGASW